MDTQRIRKQIRRAVVRELQTGTLVQVLRLAARSHGRNPTHPEIVDAAVFVLHYVVHAPAILEALEHAARAARVFHRVKSVLEAAEDYFFEPLDFIPDPLGLVALMDDAYLAHVLVQRVTDRHEQLTGYRLLPLPKGMAYANAVIRIVIGEPIASQLDEAIEQTLWLRDVQEAVHRLTRWTIALPQTPDPIWGNASVKEIVDTRMAAVTSSYSPKW